MLNPFKRKRILKQIFQEEKALLTETKRLFKVGQVSAEEPEEITKRMNRLEWLLYMIAPRNPLDWVSFLLRVGIAVILFYLAVAPSYEYARSAYLQPEMTISTSKIGETHVRQFVPITPVTVAGWPLVRMRSFTSPKIHHADNDLESETIGVVRIQDGMAVLWTERLDGRRVIRRMDMNIDLVENGGKSTVWDDLDLVGASAVSASGTTLVAGGTESLGRRGIHLQAFDGKGNPLLNRQFYRVTRDGESLRGLQAYPWNDWWVVLTTVMPPDGGSALRRRQTVVRVFDHSLLPIWERVLHTEAFHTDRYASFMPDPHDRRAFYLFTNAEPSIRTSRADSGQELYAMRFNAFGEPTDYYRLTTNGRAHDFMPSGFTVDGNGFLYLAGHRIQAPGWNDPNEFAGYPENTGKSIVYIYDTGLNAIGSVLVDDHPPAAPGDTRTGVAHTRLLKIDKRLYVAFDRISLDRQEDDAPLREVMLESFDMSQ